MITRDDNQRQVQILVIDDERLIRMTLNAKLKLIGFSAVCVASPQEAVGLLNDGGYLRFHAVITDIMMGEMDGFVFRDILRGMDPNIPIFFMTALDPEEGSGFLKRIMEDNYSFYLPKSVKTEILLKRVQSLVEIRRTNEYIARHDEESKKALLMAANVQHVMLPPHIGMTDTDFYTTWWRPQDIVSGDLFEVMPLKGGGNLYVLGDIQGHGTSAAMSMMAVQSFLKNISLTEDISTTNPAHIANLVQGFFENNLKGYSYMTALICMHRPEAGIVDWLSCGAPDLEVIDPLNPNLPDINPEHRGNLPIGMMEGTVYTVNDVVRTRLSKSAICMAITDGIFDLNKDLEGYQQLPESLRKELKNELVADAYANSSVIALPYKILKAYEAYGYTVFEDDVTELIFGARMKKTGILEKAVLLKASAIDEATQEIEAWCVKQGWSVDIVTKVQLVFEEKMMNLHDHGIDSRDRAREYACVRLKKSSSNVEMTIWDCGTQEPSMAVAAGRSDVELELKNRELNGRGRGRLIVREICNGIQRNRFGILNETTYFIPIADKLF